MKRNILHLTMATAASVAALICIMALMTSDSFASTFTFDDVPLGKSYDAFFGEIPDYDVTAYYKVKPTKKGYITFTADYSGTVVLCNSQKKVISKGSSTGDSLDPDSSYSYKKMVSYGVAKGKTYYIRVKGNPNYDSTDANYWAKVKLTNSGIVPSKCGSSKAKAKAIKRKKTVKGLIKAGDGKAKWYKVTTKRRNINVLFKAPKTNDTVKITTYMREYGHKGKWRASTHKTGRGYSPVKGPLINPNGTKWTVYFKVQRAGKSSGYYTLRWK